MKIRNLLIAFLAIAIMFGGTVYLGNYLVKQKQQSEKSQWTPGDGEATTTEIAASSTPISTYPLPAGTTTVPTSWKTYSNPELGFQISYPPNLVMNVNGAVVSLAFPKAGYFHWPLEDDAKLTISVASTCPAFDQAGEYSPATTTFSLNGYLFMRNEGHGAAAGNLYNEWSYDTKVNGSCYRIDLFDHGANGAGLYVSDQSLIKRYDDQHTVDLNAVLDIWNTATFSFKTL